MNRCYLLPWTISDHLLPTIEDQRRTRSTRSRRICRSFRCFSSNFHLSLDRNPCSCHRIFIFSRRSSRQPQIETLLRSPFSSQKIAPPQGRNYFLFFRICTFDVRPCPSTRCSDRKSRYLAPFSTQELRTRLPLFGARIRFGTFLVDVLLISEFRQGQIELLCDSHSIISHSCERQ